MQWLFFVFSTLLCGSAFASNQTHFPAPLVQGAYQFQGHYVIQQMAHQEVVDRKFEENKYQSLLNQGYGCTFKSNMVYLCKKFIQVIPSEELTQKINKKYDGYKIQVHGGFSSPALVESGEYFTSWKVEGSVEFPDMQFNDYLLVQKPNFFGAWFNRSVYSKSLEIVSDQELRQSDEFWIKKSASGNHIYYVNILFEK